MEPIKEQKRVLVLDKDSRMQPVVDELLQHGRWETLTVYDSGSVFEKARTYQPDLILLDYLLLDNDCEAVCQDFKEDPELKAIPIIIITAYRTKRAQANYFNCDALFIKPLDMQVLASRMDYLLAS